MASVEGPMWGRLGMNPGTEVDGHGVPLGAFGEPAPSEFFEVLGRILAVNGKIEYLHDRLSHLPASETNGTRKVEQFLARVSAEKSDRNAIVHSHWTFGAHMSRPEVVTAIRYKTRKQTSGEVATLSMVDVPGSEHEQDFALYTLDDLRGVLRRSVTTMQIGEQAYAQAMIKWAVTQPDTDTSVR